MTLTIGIGRGLHHQMRVFFAGILLFLGGLLPTVMVSQPADAEVPRWVVRDDDTTLVLFPTLHVMKPGKSWFTRVNQGDLRAADTLILELAPEEKAVDKMAPLLTQYARLGEGQSLFGLLPAGESLALEALVLELGMARAQISQMRPWFAGVAIASAGFKSAGYQEDAGVEKTILRFVEKQKITISGLERIEAQITLFADLDPASELSLLRRTIDQARVAPVFIQTLTKAWQDGNLKALEAILHRDLADQPALYDRVFKDRNDRWAEQLFFLMRSQEGVKYVALGAGHFVGPGNLLEQLERRGLKPVRLPDQIR